MTTAPLSNLTATWNDSGTTFNAIRMNVTNTSSATGSKILDLQIGGASVFEVLASSSIAAAYVRVKGGGQNLVGLGSLNVSIPSVVVQNTGGYGWSINSDAFSSVYDLQLLRDAPGILAQRNATNTQSSRVYSTYTSATNYQRMTLTSARTTLSGLTGASVTASGLIPDGAVVVGVTARVTTEITGASGYEIGTVADPDRWGNITGTAVGTTSDNRDWTAGTIECFTSASDVVITAKTSNFTAGAIEIAVHYLAGEAD